MDGTSLAVNLAALAASLLSLSVASLLAFRQYRAMHNANQIPVLLELIYRGRSLSFRQNEQELWTSLDFHNPKLGIGALPSDTRDKVLETELFYQNLAYLIVFRMVDRELAMLPIHYRLQRTWAAIGPFVLNERKIGGVGFEDYLSELEHLAESVDRERKQELSQNLGRRAFNTGSRKRACVGSIRRLAQRFGKESRPL
jgi:hypothetical protein